ncbi:MAG: helix-turn-helix transcriptional regulator [bacterium]
MEHLRPGSVQALPDTEQPSYTLASLQAAVEALPPGSSVTLPRDALLQALNGKGAAPPAREPEQPDRLLTVLEAAKRLGVSKRYVYGHADEYPFSRRLGPKTLRFSERGLERWLARTQR